MTYRVLTDYRAAMPQTPKDGKPYRLIACHWTAGAPGYDGLLGTIQFMLDTAYDRIVNGKLVKGRNASYHELWAFDSGNFTATRIVRPSSCAHSLNPQQPPGPYDPDGWVREALGANWWDPNQGVYAVSVCGGPSQLARYATDSRFIRHVQRRIGEIRDEIPGLVGLAEHSRFQNNKDDWGPELTPALGGHRFVTTIPDTSTEDPAVIDQLQAKIEEQQRRIGALKETIERKDTRIGNLRAIVGNLQTNIAAIEAGLPALAAKLRDLSSQIDATLGEEPPA